MDKNLKIWMECTLSTWKSTREMLEVLATWMSDWSYMYMDASKLQSQYNDAPSTNILPPLPINGLATFVDSSPLFDTKQRCWQSRVSPPASLLLQMRT
jgi:hypothetical protein